MRKNWRTTGLFLSVLLMTAFFLAGCGQRATDPVNGKETEPQTKQTERVTETETQKPTEKETETETEAFRRVLDVDYTSKDGTIKITLPDNTWKIGQDVDEMRVFQSGKDAMINIVHANTESALSSLNVMTSQPELEASLTAQYADPNAFEVISFVDAPVGAVHVYRYTVKYTSAARMWAYSVTNAIVAPDQAYVVVGSITEDNKNLLEAVQKSVSSFRVLKDETLKAVTGEVITGTLQATPQPVKTDTSSGDELQSLKDYGTTTTLVTLDQINVRLAPGTDSDVLITLDPSVAVTVTGETANWYQVNVQGNTGYIRKDFLVYGTPGQTEKTSESETNTGETNEPYSAIASAELGNETNYGAATTLYATTDVNIRALPGTDSDIAGSLGTGGAISVIGETDNWFKVSVNGTTGYISKAYLSSTQTAATPETTAEQTGDTANTAQTQEAQQQTQEAQQQAQTDAPAAAQTQQGGATQTQTGTIVSVGPDTITYQANDGQTYTVNTSDANISAANGVYEGAVGSFEYDPSNTDANGNPYATNVTG